MYLTVFAFCMVLHDRLLIGQMVQYSQETLILGFQVREFLRSMAPQFLYSTKLVKAENVQIMLLPRQIPVSAHMSFLSCPCACLAWFCGLFRLFVTICI